MKDPYKDEESGVLKNKLGIKDSGELENAEGNLIPARLMTIGEVEGNFDFEHYKAMHAHIFQDFFDWAGQERTIAIYKEEQVLNGMSVEYSQPEDIARDAVAAIDLMNSVDWDSLPLKEKAQNLADCTAQLWQAHCFREGNTRTTITFACEFAKAHGFPMDKQLFAEHSGYARRSLVMASIGQYSDMHYLYNIFIDSVQRGAEAAKALEKPEPKKDCIRKGQEIE